MSSPGHCASRSIASFTRRSSSPTSFTIGNCPCFTCRTRSVRPAGTISPRARAPTCSAVSFGRAGSLRSFRRRQGTASRRARIAAGQLSPSSTLRTGLLSATSQFAAPKRIASQTPAARHAPTAMRLSHRATTAPHPLPSSSRAHAPVGGVDRARWTRALAKPTAARYPAHRPHRPDPPSGRTLEAERPAGTGRLAPRSQHRRRGFLLTRTAACLNVTDVATKSCIEKIKKCCGSFSLRERHHRRGFLVRFHYSEQRYSSVAGLRNAATDDLPIWFVKLGGVIALAARPWKPLRGSTTPL